jgi:hypothetical protein
MNSIDVHMYLLCTRAFVNTIVYIAHPYNSGLGLSALKVRLNRPECTSTHQHTMHWMFFTTYNQCWAGVYIEKKKS